MDNLIDIPIDIEFKDLDKMLDDELKRTVAHEMHHAIRMQSIGYGDTLLETIISEGLADHFDKEIYGKRIPGYWTDALSQDQIQIYLQRVKKSFNKKYISYKWLFGYGGIPRWTAYSLGYYIIGKYLEDYKDQKASTLYNTPAQEIISNIDI